MRRKIITSAPGKLMLLGEHAVVYNRPCLVTAVEQRMRATASILDKPVFQLEAEDVGVIGYEKSTEDLGKGDIPKGAKFVEIAVRNFAAKHLLKAGIRVETKSEFSAKFGFGSSSASAVCTIKALSELLNVKLSNKQIFDLCYKTVLDIQGKGSGFDVATAIYGGILYYVTGGKVVEPLQLQRIPLVVGYTGFKASTSGLIKLVAGKAEKFPEIIESVYNEITNLVEMGKGAIKERDWKQLGQLMDFNQGYLESLGVGSSKLAAMIYAAREAGAYGAKLSGAGVGDCIIALVSDAKRLAVQEAIEAVGGEIIPIVTSAEGARVEEYK